jgi:hypothetical protein
MHRAAFGQGWPLDFVQKYHGQRMLPFLSLNHYGIVHDPSCYLVSASYVCGQRSCFPLVASSLPSCEVALR